MTSIRSTSNRRRSRSVSNSPTARRFPDTSLSIATKRARPFHASSHASRTSHEWHVDTWRRGKRRRCDTSLPDISTDFSHPSQGSDTNNTIISSGFAFSTSSADFNFFSKFSRRRASHSPPRSDGTFAEVPNQNELTRLRSNAFWELHRSVTESGEGFVQRMRDFERIRSCQISGLTRRGHKRAFHPQTIRSTSFIPDSDESDDNDDIQIFSGELSLNSSSRSSHHAKKAISIDVACHDQRNTEGRYTEVSKHAHQSLSTSSTSSDGDGLPLPTNFDLFLSPSLLSLSSTTPSPLSSPVQKRLDVVECSPISISPLSISPSTSFVNQTPISSGKAVADLSLALAHGAVGINDYGYLENLTTFQPMAGGEPGELWH